MVEIRVWKQMQYVWQWVFEDGMMCRVWRIIVEPHFDFHPIMQIVWVQMGNISAKATALL